MCSVRPGRGEDQHPNQGRPNNRGKQHEAADSISKRIKIEREGGVPPNIHRAHVSTTRNSNACIVWYVVMPLVTGYLRGKVECNLSQAGTSRVCKCHDRWVLQKFSPLLPAWTSKSSSDPVRAEFNNLKSTDRGPVGFGSCGTSQ